MNDGVGAPTISPLVYSCPEIADLHSQIPDFLCLADWAGVLFRDGFVDAARGVPMGTARVAWLHTVTLAG